MNSMHVIEGNSHAGLKYKSFIIGKDEGYFISDGTESLIYFPLKALIFKIAAKAESIIENNDFNEKKKIIDPIKKELKKAKKLDFPNKSTRKSNVLGLALTNNCNLSCIYCHANAVNNETNISLKEDIIDSAIELVLNNCKKSNRDFYLVFTGSGEPTLSWNSLKRTLEKAKSRCKESEIKFHTIMSTNGVYGIEKRKYICKNFSRVSLSIDGPQELHDKNRFTQSGKGSFATAFSTAKFFFREKLPFGIRVTLSREGVHNMVNIFEFFQGNFHGVTVAFEPLIPMGRGVDHPELVPQDKDFVNGYCEIIKKYGKDNIAYSGVSFKYVRNKYCGPVAGPHFNVDLDGVVHGCSRIGSSEKFIFGRYNSKTRRFDIDREKNKCMSEVCVDSFPECNECFARYNCAGDCHDFREKNYMRCDTNRAILWSYLIKEISKEGNCND